MNGKRLTSLVANDYLGFTQHPAVIDAAVNGILRYGSGAGASPAIGGHYAYHVYLEKKIASFFVSSAPSYTRLVTPPTARRYNAF